MAPSQMRVQLNRLRPLLFVGIFLSTIGTVLLLKLTDPETFASLARETEDWGTLERLVSFLVLISVCGIAAWFAPKIYCDYIESVAHERSQQQIARSQGNDPKRD